MKKILPAILSLILNGPVSGQPLLVAGMEQGFVPAAMTPMMGCAPAFSFNTPDGNETGIASDNNFIWVGGGAGTGIYQVDGTSGAVVLNLPMPPNPTMLYAGDLDFYNGYLWHVYEQTGVLSQIDPATGAVIDTIPLPNNSTNPSDPNNWGIACDDAYFWNAEYAVISLSTNFSYIHKISYSGIPLDSF
jgi:hypothetical protein